MYSLFGFSVGAVVTETRLTSSTQLDVEVKVILDVPLLHRLYSYGDFQGRIISIKYQAST